MRPVSGKSLTCEETQKCWWVKHVSGHGELHDVGSVSLRKCPRAGTDHPCVTASQLDEGGCTAPDENEPVRVEHPRVLRRYLVLRMTEEADTKATFTNSMQIALQEQAVLGSALLPMEVSAEVCF